MQGYRVVRAGSRFTVYREARRWWRRQGRHEGFDLVIDMINTVPFTAHRWVTGVPTVAFAHQTCEDIWKYNAPVGAATLGRRVLEPRWLRAYRDVPDDGRLRLDARRPHGVRADRRHRGPRGNRAADAGGAAGQGAAADHRVVRTARAVQAAHGPGRGRPQAARDDSGPAGLDDRRWPAAGGCARRGPGGRRGPGPGQRGGEARPDGACARPRGDQPPRGLGPGGQRGGRPGHADRRLRRARPAGLDAGCRRPDRSARPRTRWSPGCPRHCDSWMADPIEPIPYGGAHPWEFVAQQVLAVALAKAGLAPHEARLSVVRDAA